MRYLAPLLKLGLRFLKSVTKPLVMLGPTAAASATDAPVNKKILGSGTTTLIISNYEMIEILKIVKSLEYSAILLKGASEAKTDEAKEQHGGFLSMLLGTLASSFLTDMLLSKKGKRVVRAGYESKKCLLPTH